MRLEPQFWDALREICQRESISLEELVSQAVRARRGGEREGAVRVFVVSYFRNVASRPTRTQ
jgi:predicted DNA-binding ribbon-helix-helix protein